MARWAISLRGKEYCLGELDDVKYITTWTDVKMIARMESVSEGKLAVLPDEPENSAQQRDKFLDDED